VTNDTDGRITNRSASRPCRAVGLEIPKYARRATRRARDREWIGPRDEAGKRRAGVARVDSRRVSFLNAGGKDPRRKDKYAASS